MSRVENMPVPVPQQTLRRVVRTVLMHPLGRLRKAWWTLRALGTDNPPLPRPVASMLFVCLGNICRSPFGAELAKRLLADTGRADIICASAGIRPSQDNRSPDEACRACEAYGVTLTAHRPQALTPDLVQSHDIVVVMEWSQLAHLRAVYPEHRDRFFLLPLFDEGARNAYERYNIPDPFGEPLSSFEECYARMNRALRTLIARIAS